jgi:hypothetical protein
MRLKRWVVVLAMVLALGCGEEKSSVGGNDGRDIEFEAPLNATSAGSEAGERDARSSIRRSNCRIEAEKLCEWRSGQSPTAYTQQQLDECVARVSAKCEEGGQ